MPVKTFIDVLCDPRVHVFVYHHSTKIVHALASFYSLHAVLDWIKNGEISATSFTIVDDRRSPYEDETVSRIRRMQEQVQKDREEISRLKFKLKVTDQLYENDQKLIKALAEDVSIFKEEKEKADERVQYYAQRTLNYEQKFEDALLEIKELRTDNEGFEKESVKQGELIEKQRQRIVGLKTFEDRNFQLRRDFKKVSDQADDFRVRFELQEELRKKAEDRLEEVKEIGARTIGEREDYKSRFIQEENDKARLQEQVDLVMQDRDTILAERKKLEKELKKLSK